MKLATVHPLPYIGSICAILLQQEPQRSTKLAALRGVSVRVPFYGGELPKIIISKRSNYLLKQTTPALWRTRLISPSVDSEEYYYQQILIYLVIYGTTFERAKLSMMRATEKQQKAGLIPSWKDFFVFLVQKQQIQHEIPIPTTLTQDIELHADPGELSPAQQYVFNRVVNFMQHNMNAHFIMGAAGTRKSYLLNKFAYHFH